MLIIQGDVFFDSLCNSTKCKGKGAIMAHRRSEMESGAINVIRG